MIAWWWLPITLFGVWLPVIGVAAFKDDEVLDAVKIVAFAAASLPLLPLVWLVTHLDVGATPLQARSVERFARMRSADRTHPAWAFSVWNRGVIILRKWEPGSDRRTVTVRSGGESDGTQ